MSGMIDEESMNEVLEEISVLNNTIFQTHNILAVQRAFPQRWPLHPWLL